jgi:integrase/recombinase XerD
MIQVIGKRNKARSVLVGTEVLNDYLSKINISQNENYIFTNKKGNILTQSYFHRQIMQIIDMKNIKTAKKGVHLLRHTFATRLYQQTKDLVLVQEVLGHGDINTTRIYTHFSNHRLEACVGIMDEFKDRK